MILVTGASGFIGSNLCELLLQKGHKVLGVDCYFPNYDKWIKKYSLRHCLSNPNFIFLENNILDPNMSKLIEGLSIDCIVHLADIPGVTTCSEINFDEYIRYNITATQRLLEAIKYKGVKKLIYASSSTVYGESEGLPMSELNNPKPISLYGVTKLAGETLSQYYGKSYGIDITVLRFFTTYGPNQRPDMAFHKFIKDIILGNTIEVYGDGTQKRDFIYVRDVCKIIMKIIEKNITDEVINVGGGQSLSVIDSIKIIEEILNKKALIRNQNPINDEQIFTHACVSKLNKFISINDITDINDGIIEEVRYIKKLYNI